MENWVPNQETQIDDDDVFVDNTQVEGTSQATNPKKMKYAQRAACWNDYDVLHIDKVRHSKCKKCGTLLKTESGANGTSSMIKHTERCKMNPKNLEKKLENQTTLNFKKNENGENSIGTWKHDEKRIKKALLNLFVVGELPFKFVENESFIEYTNALNGKVILPCRTTISNRVTDYFLEEKAKLFKFFNNPLSNVHLMTDCWTSSCQRSSYMVVTAHFIDEDWVMHKRIINFKSLDSHKGEDIGRTLLTCLQEWGINNVMTITIDNASANDKAIEILMKKLPNLYDGGKQLHVRCMAHILNLIVRDGFDQHQSSIKCMQKAVKYIRNFTQRIQRFKECMKELNVESKKFLCNDSPTRWNSTYELLKIAVELEKVFGMFEVKDPTFVRDVLTPSKEDFNICRAMVGFLEKFKVKTDIVSTSTKPMTHRFFGEICDVYKHIKEWAASPQFCLIGKDMIDKYDKYWGDLEKLNDFLYFAVILDPRFKFDFLQQAFEKLIKLKNPKKDPILNSEVILKDKVLIRGLQQRFENFFYFYKSKFDNTDSSQNQTHGHEDVVVIDDENDFMGDLIVQTDYPSASMETELTRYLNEQSVKYNKDFDILLWWKQNASRYPIVSRMAKDILGLQISTVASEAAFSTSGRILDLYRTNLSANIVEALVCTQDWVRKSRKQIVDNIDEILKDDEVAKALEDAINNGDGKGKQPINILE
uniref:BED-type domain-containing protein n=1 Tax=Lactuca sativa TaxID=4236 RepID=A0A9R1WS20_LACSA|nr:hypothetical protein LSAT_V11C100045650 [Lactuca sativa]